MMFTKIILLHVPEKSMNNMRTFFHHRDNSFIWGVGVDIQTAPLCMVGFTNMVLIDEPGTIGLFSHPPIQNLNPDKSYMMVGPGPSGVWALIQYDQWVRPSIPNGPGQIHLFGQASNIFKSLMLIWPAPFMI